MSIVETSKIDIVAVLPGSPVVKLVIADHLAWDDFDSHARLLQDKINTYVEFVESGQLSRLTAVKIPVAPVIRITLAVQHEPSMEAKALLALVEKCLVGVGIQFELELRK